MTTPRDIAPPTYRFQILSAVILLIALLAIAFAVKSDVLAMEPDPGYGLLPSERIEPGMELIDGEESCACHGVEAFESSAVIGYLRHEMGAAEIDILMRLWNENGLPAMPEAPDGATIYSIGLTAPLIIGYLSGDCVMAEFVADPVEFWKWAATAGLDRL